MNAIALTETAFGRPAIQVTLSMPRFMWGLVRRREERRCLVRLSRLPPHLIRDAGFEPEAVYDAVSGTWDEVNPGRYRIR